MVQNAQIGSNSDSKSLTRFLPYLGASVSAVAGFNLVLPTVATDVQAQEPVLLAPVQAEASATSNAPVLAPMQEAIEVAAKPLLPQIDSAAVFQEAEALIAESQFRNAYDLLSQIPNDHPDYEKAQELKKTSAWAIVTHAVRLEWQGNRKFAQLNMNRVPLDSEARVIADGYLKEWNVDSGKQVNAVNE